MSATVAAIERMYRRILMVVGRGRIKTGRDDGPAQLLQVRLGQLETVDNIPRLAEYGFQSMPPADTDAIVLFAGGNRSDGVIIATGSQKYRMRSLKTGEVSISDDQGQSVYLTRTGIVINGGGFPITLENAPTITLDSAHVKVTGNASIGTGATGTFTTPMGDTVTVQDGIVTNIF
jgi:phage baseplate assembly protein V